MSLRSDERNECLVKDSQQGMGRSRLCQDHKQLVLDLIIDNEGDDRLVESTRGKFFRAPSEEAEIIKKVLDAEVTEANAINAAETNELRTMGEELAHELGGSFC